MTCLPESVGQLAALTTLNLSGCDALPRGQFEWAQQICGLSDKWASFLANLPDQPTELT